MVHDLLHLALGLLHAIIIASVLGSLFNWKSSEQILRDRSCVQYVLQQFFGILELNLQKYCFSQQSVLKLVLSVCGHPILDKASVFKFLRKNYPSPVKTLTFQGLVLPGSPYTFR